MIYSKKELEARITRAREIVLWLLEGDDNALSGSCFYHAFAMHMLCGLPIVGGTYSWRLTKYDNGRNPTHFSCNYGKEAQIETAQILSSGEHMGMLRFPEMHVWNVWQGKILDLSTIHLPDFAMRTNGFRFDPDCTPPEYFFGKPKDNKHRWLYSAHPLATKLAREIAEGIKLKGENKWTQSARGS